MTDDAATAFRVADRLRLEGAWEVYAERLRRYEIYLNGTTIELSRGPLWVEGVGIRVFRPRDGRLGVGFQATSDLSPEGLRSASADAEASAAHSVFPAKQVDLSASSVGQPSGVEILDRTLWDDPRGAVEAYLATLVALFDGRRDVTPSFGSVRATLTETSISNSAGLEARFPHTRVDLEIAVKAFGGPEGPAPGEYWVNETARRLVPATLPGQVDAWCRYAEDARRASPPPTGELAVVFPPEVLGEILPAILTDRFTGSARLQEMAPEPGTKVGVEGLTIRDDGRFPWGPFSAPIDDEGAAQRTRNLVDHGTVSEILYSVVDAGAFAASSTGSGLRGQGPVTWDWRRFLTRPVTATTTVVVESGPGGTTEELIEAAGDGLFVQQLGAPSPDSVTTAFGGELRIGYRIRRGRIAEPVRGGTVGGLGIGPPGNPSLLARAELIGSTPTLSGTLYSPPILVRPFAVAGS